MPRRTLLIVAKEPRAGTVKTRLAATIGPQRAADLYQAFSADTFRVIADLPHTQLAVSHWPPAADDYFRATLDPAAQIYAQCGDNFGARLHSAFVHAAASAEQIVLIGTDSPSLPLEYIQVAFAYLDDPAVDVVLGPCEDGGWYLMGLHRPQPAIFRDIAWSTEHTCAQTLARIADLGLNLRLLPSWYDIDTAADLQRLHTDLAARDDAARSATLPLLRDILEELAVCASP